MVITAFRIMVLGPRGLVCGWCFRLHPQLMAFLVAARFSRGSRDPAAELPAVVAVADRLGVVSRIALNADAWDARPQRVMIIGHRVVRLDWFDAWDAHTIRLLGAAPRHPDLLVIPRHRHGSGPGLSGDGGGPGRVPESTGRGPRDLRPDRSPAGPAASGA